MPDITRECYDAVVNTSFRAPPTQDAVPENEFHALTFSIDSSV